MSVNQLQSSVTAKVWQAIAQSGLDVSAVERETMNKLVDIVVDAALEEVDDQLEQANHGQDKNKVVDVEAFDDEDELILWVGRPFLSLSLHYTITNERIRVVQGLLGKNYDDIELVRVQEIDFTQTMTERTMSIGDVHIKSHDSSHPKIILENVKNPKEVHEILRRAVIKARQKHRLSYREEM